MICAGWIRFRASLMAMRRTSWIDQRINDGVTMLWVLLWSGVSFFLAAADWRDGGSPPSWRRRASPGKRGDATHARICSRCDRARARFSRSQNCPRSPTDGLHRHQRFDGCCRWAPGGEEGEIAIGDMTTDQQTACPKTMICVVKFFGLEIGQFEIAPIMQPRSFGSVPCRQAFPVGRTPRRGDVRGVAGDGSPLAPGLKHMSAADPEYIAFARLT